MISVSNKASILFSSVLFLCLGSSSSSSGAGGNNSTAVRFNPFEELASDGNVWEPCLDCPQPCYNNKTAVDLSQDATTGTYLYFQERLFEPCFLNNTAFEPTPNFPEPCAASHNAVCDDADCDGNGFGADIRAAGVGFYRYVDVDADGNKWGVQYYLCSCRSNNTYDFKARRGRLHSPGATVWAKSVCKINQVRIPFPKDSNESCSDLNLECFDHCNDVVFEGWGDTILAPPEGESGYSGIWSSSGSSYTCRCGWDDENDIEGCIDPDDYGSTTSSGTGGTPDDNYGPTTSGGSPSNYTSRKFGLLLLLLLLASY